MSPATGASRFRKAPGWVVTGSLLLLGVVWGCGERDETPSDPDLERLRAENAIAQGRSDWARIHYANDFARHPERLESLREEGLAWLSGYQQSLSEGIARLETYLEQADPEPEIERRLVSSLLLLGEWERARQRLDRLGEGAEADRLRAEALAESDLAAARQAIARALSEAPDRAAIRALAARLAEAAGDSEEARRQAQAAVELDPLDYPSHYLLGRLARRDRDVGAARQALERHQLASRLRHDGTLAPPEPEEALELLDRLQESMPEASAGFRRSRIEPLLALGRLAEAADLVGALADGEELPVATLQDMAVQLGNAGRTRQARELFERVLARSPGHVGATASLIQLDLEAGDLEATRIALAEALELHPHLARLHLLASRLATIEDRTDDALVSIGRALELAPWESGWRVEGAELQLALGLDEAAKRRILAAPEETPVLEAFRLRHAELFPDDPAPGPS